VNRLKVLPLGSNGGPLKGRQIGTEGQEKEKGSEAKAQEPESDSKKGGGAFSFPEQSDRGENVREGDTQCHLQGVESWKEQKRQKESPQSQAYCFEDIDPSYGGGVLLKRLAIELATVSEEGSVGDRHREKYDEGAEKDRTRPEGLSRCCSKKFLEDPGKVKGGGKGDGKEELKEDVNLELSFGSLCGFAEGEGAKGFEGHPIREENAEGEFIAQERNEELPQEQDLRADAAYAHDDERDSEGGEASHP